MVFFGTRFNTISFFFFLSGNKEDTQQLVSSLSFTRFCGNRTLSHAPVLFFPSLLGWVNYTILCHDSDLLTVL